MQVGVGLHFGYNDVFAGENGFTAINVGKGLLGHVAWPRVPYVLSADPHRQALPALGCLVINVEEYLDGNIALAASHQQTFLNWQQELTDGKQGGMKRAEKPFKKREIEKKEEKE